MSKRKPVNTRFSDLGKVTIAAEVLDKGQKVSKVAKEFGVAESTVYMWVKALKDSRQAFSTAAKAAAPVRAKARPHIGPEVEKEKPKLGPSRSEDENARRCLLLVAEVESLNHRIKCLEAMILAA